MGSLRELDDGLLDELAAVLPGVPLTTEAGELRAHSRDCWPSLAMRERSGETLPSPGAVVWPRDAEEVSRLYAWATRTGVPIVPFGGGGGVVGGALPVPGCVTLDTKLMRRIGPLDEVSGLVTVEPGVVGQNLEEWLGARGWTLGHFPSSITISTVGGFAAARSAGQASTKYGKFEHMVAGLQAVLPDGRIVSLRAHPASAAGPDLAGLILGSEGTLGLVTAVHLRVHPKPESMLFRGFRLPSFSDGLDVVRTVLQRDLHPAVLRLYDEHETQLNHAEVAPGCLLIAGSEGWPGLVELEASVVAAVVAEHGGTDLGPEPGKHWHAHRYDVSYRLADLVKPGGLLGDAVAIDTCEVAATWAGLPETYTRVRAALATEMDLVLCHASHAYSDGAALYFTFGAAGQGDEAAVRRRYDAAWSAAMDAAVATGATITHHHGVGTLRAPWLAAELGEGGMAMLTAIKRSLDPAGIANPGKLGLDRPEAP